jgi:type II secretory pathway pseudopilin PulG
MTLVELLVSLLITGAVVATLVNVSVGQLRTSQRAAALSAVEATISSDLAWLRYYATIWKLQAGPFDLTNSQTKTASYVRASRLDYEPGGACDDINIDTNTVIPLATFFLADAATATTTPARPQTVPSAAGSTTLSLPNAASGFTLTRTIAVDENSLVVDYSLGGSDAPPLNRKAVILVEASAWCF